MLHSRLLLTLTLTCSIWSGSVTADVRLPQLVSSGMVLQRDEPLQLWGWADPGERLTLRFNDSNYAATADEDGRWRIPMPALPAGGPHRMTIAGNNTIELEDILVGDVWLASGQSNMELTLARAEPRFPDLVPQINNPKIRQFDVPDRYNFKAPEADMEGGQWLPATQDNIRTFSAVAYFFAAELNQEQDVPIGIINASLGGSPVEAWISEDTLKTFAEPYREARRFRDDRLIDDITQADQNRSNAWFEELNKRDKGLKQGNYLWAAPSLDTSGWMTLQVPGYWPEGKTGPVNGVFWFRKAVEVPAPLAKQDALLVLGAIVDADQVFVNGTQVGETGYMYPPRRYKVPAGLLQSGTNTITVRVTSQKGRGGFVPDKEYALKVGDQSIDLRGDWHYRLGAAMPERASPTFIRWKPLGLYNGMIAPLVNYRIKGVIWYQGESNAGDADNYRERFPAMIKDWRQQWRQGDFPFLFVQLANYLPPGEQQSQDGGWAWLREAQLEALSVPNTSMVVAIDLGEWNDIHPLDKKTLGERLAAAALHLAYDKKKVYSGPLFKAAQAEGKRITLTFEHTGSGLTAKNGALKGFSLAGADRKFHPAEAEIRGNQVVVWSEHQSKPLAVRYAWASNPEGANLYNKEGFPASPFRTDNW